MNIRQIEVFKAMMNEGSVTAAAAALGRSQPSVSKHLALMEDDIGIALFVRSGNRLVPTEEAMRLFEQIEQTYRGIDHLSRFVADLREHHAGELSIAAMPLLARAWLPDVVADFMTRHVSVSMSLPVRSSRWILDSVAAGQADIGIGLPMGDDAGVTSEFLMSLPVVCVLRSDHHLCTRDVIAPKDLSGETLISLSNFDHWRLAVERTLELHDVTPARRVDSFTTYMACELASRVSGLAIVDALTARDYTGGDLTWRPFAPALGLDVYLMRSQHKRLSGLTRELVDDISVKAKSTEVEIEAWLSDGPGS